jgi:hypothetical protein
MQQFAKKKFLVLHKVMNRFGNKKKYNPPHKDTQKNNTSQQLFITR